MCLESHLLQKVPPACTGPSPAAGHHQPTPPPETSGHSRTHLGQSLVGSLLLFPGSWRTQGFACTLQESVFPVLYKFWGLNGGVSGDFLQESLCYTQVYCSQSPRPGCSPLLTHTTTGDTQTQFWLSLCGVSGSWYAEDLFEPPQHLWLIWGLILNTILPLLWSCWGFSFVLGHRLSFFGGMQCSPVDSCSAASCNFGVLTGEDEHTSFYSTILDTAWLCGIGLQIDM